MAIYVYISETVLNDAKKHNFTGELAKIAQKIEKDQSFKIFEHFPAPFMKKSLGKNYRLISSKSEVGEDTIISFIRLVVRSSAEYDQFASDSTFFNQYIPTDERISDFHTSRIASPIPEKPFPSQVDNLFLFNILGREDESGSNFFVYETSTWVQRFNSAEFKPFAEILRIMLENLGSSSLENTGNHIYSDDRFSNIRILLKIFPDDHAIFLVTPLLEKEDEESFIGANKIIFDSERLTSEVKQCAIKSYPLYLVIDSQIWLSVESDHGTDNRSANLSLSPEEVTLLESVNETLGSFPLFINGRPGSGKSTLLQYLYSDYLKFFLINKDKMGGYLPPVYLTYSEELLKDAKKHIRNIIRNHYKNLVENETIDAEELDNINSMMLFQDFLMQNVPEADLSLHFNPFKKFYFKDFKLYYSDFRMGNPQLNRISPEIAWHVIRSYIKGMQSEDGLFDLHLYQELPLKRKSVSERVFELIEKQVYPWLENLYQQNGFWDDQDLAIYVRTKGLMKDYFPAIFCDEAQDFTKIELEILNECSLYHKKKIQTFDLAKVPIAFAGDPFQTLNPTGFKWESVKDLFRDSLILANNSKDLGNFDFNYHPLSYNYRSAANVVHLCNLILLVRSLMFSDKDAKPQIPWGSSSQIWPVYLNIGNKWVQSKFSDQPDITYILPCDEGEESEFIANDDFLKTLQTSETISKGVFLSSILSKGRQFPRIVLYKFSEHVSRSYDFVNLLGQSEQNKPDLTLEYFFNKLYVAASRPYNHLFILEANDLRENHLWGFLSKLNADIIQKYNSDPDWLNELQEVEPGSLLTQVTDPGFDLDSSKEDPLEVAMNLAELGKTTKSSNVLRQAAARLKFFKNKIADGLQCEALALIYENKFSLAGEVYKQIPNYKEAIDCYWTEGNYKAISDLNANIPLVSEDIRYRVSTFIANTDSDALEFLDFLYAHFSSVGSYKFDENFAKALSTLVDKLMNQILDSKQYAKLEDLTRYQKNVDHRKMANIAMASNFRKQAFQHFMHFKPQNDLEFLRLITEFSDSLEERVKAHFVLREYDQIRDLVDKEGFASLSTSVLDMVFDSYISIGLYDRAEDMLEKMKEHSESIENERKVVDNYLKLTDALANAKLSDRSLNLFEGYMTFKLKKGYWQDSIKILNKKSYSFPSGNLVAINKNYRDRLSKILLLTLIDTDDFISKKVSLNDKKEVQNYLEQYISGIKDILSLHVSSLKIIGAALEQADAHGMALEFYGKLIWSDEKFDFMSKNHFQKRWLKMNEKRLEYFTGKGDEERARKIRIEQREKSKLWNLRSLETIPEKVEISYSEKKSYLDNIAGEILPKEEHRIIRLPEVNKEKNPGVMKCSVPLYFGPKTISLALTYYKDKNKWILQKKDDVVVFDIKKNELIGEEWGMAPDGVWENESWEFGLMIAKNSLTVLSKKDPRKTHVEVQLI